MHKKGMRYFIIFFVFSSHLAFGQLQLIGELKAQMGTDWIKSNPEFKKTRTSFLDNANIKKYYIAPINWSGRGIPFFWDCDLSALEYLLDKEKQFNTLVGNEADEYFKGTKLTWQEVKATIWVNRQYYDVELTDWHLMEVNDCRGTISFPSISFSKTFELANARTNNLEGLVFISDELIRINLTTQFETQLTQIDGKIVKGTGFDINGDQITDLFYYSETQAENEFSEGDDYNRLYANIGGIWKCIYVELLEICI